MRYFTGQFKKIWPAGGAKGNFWALPKVNGIYRLGPGSQRTTLVQNPWKSIQLSSFILDQRDGATIRPTLPSLEPRYLHDDAFLSMPARQKMPLPNWELFLRLCSAFPLNHSHKVPASSCSITKSHHLCSTSEMLCATPVSWLIDLKQLKTEEGTLTTFFFEELPELRGTVEYKRHVVMPSSSQNNKASPKNKQECTEKVSNIGLKAFPCQSSLPLKTSRFRLWLQSHMTAFFLPSECYSG